MVLMETTTMAMNRVQFQPGLSMAEFIRRYGSERQCEQALIAARWRGDGFRCPHFGDSRSRSSTFEREGRHYWQCCRCRRQTTATGRHHLRGDQAAADDLVSGDASAHPVEEQCLGAGAAPASGRVVCHRPDDQAQAHAGHSRS